MRLFALTLCLTLLHQHVMAAGPIGQFIQTNVIGFPVIHESQSWVFDPDLSLRRRKQFVELHGDKGDKLIERLGLGIDGYADQRLMSQRARDVGHLGGLNSLNP